MIFIQYFFRDIDKVLKIHSMTEKINPKILFIIKIYTFEYYVKFSFWVSVLLIVCADLFGFCFVVHYLVSFLVFLTILTRKRCPGCFAVNCLPDVL